jgi:DNA-binding CsgD family transcriptional regulator
MPPKHVNLPAPKSKYAKGRHLKRKTSVTAQRTRKMAPRRQNITKHANPEKLSTEDKKQAILELRIEGHSEYDIGVVFGISQARVSQLLKDILTEKTEAVAEMGDQLRTMELERIDRMILAWYRAAKKDPRAADVLLRWIERRHKILPGLEVSRNEMGGIGGGPIRMSSSSSIDITKLGDHRDGDRLLANLDEILRIAGPQVELEKDELPAIEHKPKKDRES